MNREGGGWGPQGVSEEGRSAREKPPWRDDGTEEEIDDVSGKWMEGKDSSSALCHCNTPAPLHLYKSFHSNHDNNDHNNAKKIYINPIHVSQL